MSAIKKMLEEHEDGVCDRSTCLKCAEDGPNIQTPAQDEDGTQPMIRPDELQAQLQARVNELQGKTPLQGMMDQAIAKMGLPDPRKMEGDELQAFATREALERVAMRADERSRDYQCGLFLLLTSYMKDDPSLLSECAYRMPGGYDILRAQLLDLESQMLDEARSDYERDELLP